MALDGELHTDAEIRQLLMKTVSPEYFVRLVRDKKRSPPRYTHQLNWWISKAIGEMRCGKLVVRYGFDGKPITGRLHSGQPFKIRLTAKGIAHYKKVELREEAKEASEAKRATRNEALKKIIVPILPTAALLPTLAVPAV